MIFFIEFKADTLGMLKYILLLINILMIFLTLGWLMGTATLVPFVVFAIIEMVKTNDFKSLLKPTQYWGPQETPEGRRVDRSRTM